ncbi:hypothetical protein [Thalassoroseus pseudoceratinae]|uniref:hypothetical protein n=1 Tax=Thalassoroseus pseudoceratinae TaxID=2713176 RepID=UPI001421FE95|nr:hypothetical protein [Thalassoroseus pseudoceratinae]
MERKNRKTGKPQALFPDLADNILEQHLDLTKHKEVCEFVNGKPARDDDFCWLGLHAPKASTIEAIDLDNKENVLGFSRIDDKWIPVAPVTLGQFFKIKRLYDAFPNRVWCISSLTMGLHVWEKHPRPKSITAIEKDVRPTLVKLGLPKTEIHPMKGRCLRRPFGKHYVTITPDGLLEDWMKQLEFFVSPHPLSFEDVFKGIMRVQVDWLKLTTSSHRFEINHRNKDHEFLRNGRPDGDKLMANINDLFEWADAGFKVDASILEGHAAAEQQRGLVQPTIPQKTGFSATIDLKKVCDGQWIQNCCGWAKDGLPHDDCFWLVYHNLCVWFYFVELFHLPESERIEETLALLVSHATFKSNGFISNSEPIEQRMRRLVLHTIENVENKYVMARIRQKRSNGEYRQLYCLASNMLTPNAVPIVAEKDNNSPSLRTSLHVGAFDGFVPEDNSGVLDTELREKMHRYYEKHDITVKKKTITKLVKFVNYLVRHRFKAMLDGERLKVLGFGDGRQRKHLEHLDSMKIIHRLDYCPKKRIARIYSVRKEVRALFYEKKRQKVSA